AGDFVTGTMVNLCGTGDDDETPRDVYKHVIDRAKELIKVDNNCHAAWWRERLPLLDEKQQRKLLKHPIMTFAYNVTENGAQPQVPDTYPPLYKREERVDPSTPPLTSPGPNYGQARLGAMRWYQPEQTPSRTRKRRKNKKQKNKKRSGWREQQWL